VLPFDSLLHGFVRGGRARSKKTWENSLKNV
jgi:hypothetical protein